MNLTGFLLRSRGVVGLTKRIPGLFVRFGITDSKIASCLHSFVDITERYGALPTFATTANLIPRYPKLFRDLQDRGVEFALHGLVHTDYARLSLDEQMRHIEKAMRIFAEHGIEFSGFRCPYLSSNRDTIAAVDRLSLKWESSDVVSWDVLNFSEFTAHQVDAYRKVNELYGAKKADYGVSLPRIIGGIIEIPVSIPDDEALVDRLGVKSRAKIASVWNDILLHSYARGELFTMQLHHERIGFCGMALTTVLDEARRLRPAIWIAQLRDISDWVSELKDTKLEVNRESADRFTVRVSGSHRATVLVKNADTVPLTSDWAGDYGMAFGTEFAISSTVKPVVGVAPVIPAEIIARLREDGYMVDICDNDLDCSVFLDGNHRDYEELLDTIEASVRPLIRLWRWPYGARSALSCTGDIDSITIIDFARRFVEV